MLPSLPHGSVLVFFAGAPEKLQAGGRKGGEATEREEEALS